MTLPINPVQRRDNYICQYCGKDGLASAENWHDSTVDHVLPRKHGGTDDPHNLVTSCHYCNSIKGYGLFASFEDARDHILKRREELQAIFEGVKKAVRGPST
jgi:5-methylcytosine-specific restriction endonuclease McrA